MSTGLKEDSLLLNDGVFRATSTCTVLTHRISRGELLLDGQIKGMRKEKVTTGEGDKGKKG